MTFLDEITEAVKSVATANWNVRNGLVVPNTDDVTLKNGAVELDAVYLYADMADSTGLARDFPQKTAAKVVRAYLDASCRIIRKRGGEIRSFDGDRVMAIFIGESKNSEAAKCGLQIAYAVSKIVRPILETNLPSLKTNGFIVTHCVGIASGKALIVRGGVRDNNDLVSIGRAPNVGAKLSDIRHDFRKTYITSDVFSRLNKTSKYGGSPERLMWDGPEDYSVGDQDVSIYGSSWTWSP